MTIEEIKSKLQFEEKPHPSMPYTKIKVGITFEAEGMFDHNMLTYSTERCIKDELKKELVHKLLATIYADRRKELYEACLKLQRVFPLDPYGRQEAMNNILKVAQFQPSSPDL